jgi:hypothetical protein
MLCAIFAGSYFWEVQSASPEGWRPPGPKTTRYAAAVLAILTLAALIEVALSFGRFPFTYGQRCREVQPLANDGWTTGALRVQIPSAASSAEMVVFADRPDLDRRSLELDLFVLSGSGALLSTQQFGVRQRASSVQGFQISLPDSPDGKRFLELKPSHCYVPLNLGITYDPRRLGVHLKELRFRSAAGDEVK